MPPGGAARGLATVALLTGLAASASARGHPARCTVRLAPGEDLQRAVDRAPTSPAVRICLAAGEFRLPRFLSITRDGVTLRGAGPSTVVRLADGVQSPVIVVGDFSHETPERTASSVTIERLRLVGGGPGGAEAERDHPYLTNSVVVVRAGRRIVLRDLDVTACRSACLLTEKGTSDVSIERNRLAGSVWDGISLNRTSGARLVGNVIRANTAAGITAEHLEDSLLEGNVIERNKTHGLYLSDSYRNRVAGNRFADNVLSGVFLTCAVRDSRPPVRCWDRSMSQGNRFTGNTFTGNRVGFTSAPNAAAPCTTKGFVPNRSQGDRFARNPRDEPGPVRLGRCIVFDGRRR